jgi:prepilin-type N-terminal cleavage/methylation domain-containing protein
VSERRRPQGGMTLIEVMVALALLTMLATGMVETFLLAQRDYVRTIELAETSDDIVGAQRFLTRALESAYPFRPNLGTRQDHFGLEGAADQVLFSAPAPSSGQKAGFYRYRVRAEHRGRTVDLVVGWTLDRDGTVTPETDLGVSEHTAVLLRDIADVKWSYADVDLPTGGPSSIAWQTTWLGNAHLPRLVRLEILFPIASRREWPVMIVAPVVTDDALCAFDIVSQRCREESL